MVFMVDFDFDFDFKGCLLFNLYESELQAQLISTDHPKSKPYLINTIHRCMSIIKEQTVRTFNL